MSDLLQQAVRTMLHGLLTELPAQLLTAAVAAAVAARWRARRRRRVTLPAQQVPPATEQ